MDGVLMPGQIVMRNPYGRYVWYPELSLVDYVEQGKIEGMQIDCLDQKENTEMGALIVAAKHVVQEVEKRR
jgi:hypothetical protein